MRGAAATADAAASAVMARQLASTSMRRGLSPKRFACWIISPVSPREPRSAHRLDLEVILSVASATPLSSIQSTRAAVSACMIGVFGVRDRIAAIATVLSVKE